MAVYEPAAFRIIYNEQGYIASFIELEQITLHTHDTMSSTADLITPESSIENTDSSVINLNAASDIFGGYDHVTWYVSNAKQTAYYYCANFGFKPVAYRGLETGSRDISSHVIRKGQITFLFISALREKASLPENRDLVDEIHQHVSKHGDAVKDVAFSVDNAAMVYYAATKRGIQGITNPKVVSDTHGEVTIATVKATGDTTHTLVERHKYAEHLFLPGYAAVEAKDSALDSIVGDTYIYRIDHCVSNQGWNEMEQACEYYEKALGFHKFWSVDDKQIFTEYSALRSTVMASSSDLIKMPVNEPAEGKKRSQIEEFIEFNSGPGIQHIALLTDNIIGSISNMNKRGVEFIQIPSSYYDVLRQRLSTSAVQIKEDLETLQSLNILVDFDDNGYLLQLFTKPLNDRPTLFIEIIQRENFDGFGAGNFKSLFESIERDQLLRNTL